MTIVRRLVKNSGPVLQEVLFIPASRRRGEMMVIKLLNVEQALKVTERLMADKGYVRHKSSTTKSLYFAKSGKPYKIRFSDHAGRLDALNVHEEIIEPYTIENDVMFRVNRATIKYDNFIRNLKKKA